MRGVSAGGCPFGCLWCTTSIELLGLVEVLVDVVNLKVLYVSDWCRGSASRYLSIVLLIPSHKISQCVKGLQWGFLKLNGLARQAPYLGPKLSLAKIAAPSFWNRAIIITFPELHLFSHTWSSSPNLHEWLNKEYIVVFCGCNNWILLVPTKVPVHRCHWLLGVRCWFKTVYKAGQQLSPTFMPFFLCGPE